MFSQRATISKWIMLRWLLAKHYWECMFVWHHLYVNPAPVHRDVRQFLSHAALPCYPLAGVSSVTLLWFLIQTGLLPRMRSEQMPSLRFKSHHSARLVHVASGNTAADSCCPSSKTVLAPESNFPVVFLVTQYSFTAENLDWEGRTGMQCSELALLLAGFFLQFGAMRELTHHLV